MDVAGFRPRRFAVIAMCLVMLTGSVGCSMIGPTTANSFITQIETSRDPNVRFTAYEKLGADSVYDTPEQRAKAVKVLLAALAPNKEPTATRAVVCRTLGSLGDPAGREPMIRLVTDNDTLVRTEAIRALGKLGRPEDATILMQRMTLDPSNDCRVAAIEALGSMKAADPRTPGYLVDAMENDDPGIRLAAYQSLKQITKHDAGVKTEAWRTYLASKDLPDLPTTAKAKTVDRAAKPASH
jgi:HEAT repeat protein